VAVARELAALLVGRVLKCRRQIGCDPLRLIRFTRRRLSLHASHALVRWQLMRWEDALYCSCCHRNMPVVFYLEWPRRHQCLSATAPLAVRLLLLVASHSSFCMIKLTLSFSIHAKLSYCIVSWQIVSHYLSHCT